MAEEPYQKIVLYRCEILGEAYLLSDGSGGLVEFEEERKNGQEDCHVSGMAELLGGEWLVSEVNWCGSDEEEGDFMQAVEDFLDRNGPPHE